jgi:hypothetical protein
MRDRPAQLRGAQRPARQQVLDGTGDAQGDAAAARLHRRVPASAAQRA